MVAERKHDEDGEAGAYQRLEPNVALPPSSPVGGRGLSGSGAPAATVPPPHHTALLLRVRYHHRLRTGYLRAQTKLTLQAKAFCRALCEGDKTKGAALYSAAVKTLGGKGHAAFGAHRFDADPTEPDAAWEEGAKFAVEPDDPLLPPPTPLPKFDQWQIDGAVLAIAPLLLARQALHAPILKHTKEMETLVATLPVYPWVKSIRGFGALGLAQILAETGDLSLYANPGKVWKRMGLALVAGERQRRVTDKELALAMGYAPQRRSIMFVIGDSLVKLNGSGPCRTFYDNEKARQAALYPEMPKIAHHLRAHRHMTKFLLKGLWRQWRDTSSPEPV